MTRKKKMVRFLLVHVHINQVIGAFGKMFYCVFADVSRLRQIKWPEVVGYVEDIRVLNGLEQPAFNGPGNKVGGANIRCQGDQSHIEFGRDFLFNEVSVFVIKFVCQFIRK